jgi:hypothetical protein
MRRASDTPDALGKTKGGSAYASALLRVATARQATPFAPDLPSGKNGLAAAMERADKAHSVRLPPAIDAIILSRPATPAS